MRTVLSGIAVLGLAVASMSAVVADPMGGGSMMSKSSMSMMPKCTPATGPVVWYVAVSKKYYLKGSAMYGKGHGAYVCRATAVARGGKPGAGGAMGGGSMGGGSMGGGSMGGGMTGHPMTMEPRPMSSAPGSMPGSMGPGNVASPIPGTRSPGPSGGAMGSASGNQGNTGQPGAGGQVPNNPASTSNSSPNPRPSSRP